MSAICRHRGMLVAEGSGNCRGAFVCPYHGWSYDLNGRLRGAPQMSERTGLRSQHDCAAGAARRGLERHSSSSTSTATRHPWHRGCGRSIRLMRDWQLGELRGEFLRDKNYKMHFEHPWNWKIYAEGQSECYHCDKLHSTAPIMHAMDFGSMRMHVDDTPNGVWAFELRSKELDPTINQHGRAILPHIPSLSPGAALHYLRGDHRAQRVHRAHGRQRGDAELAALRPDQHEAQAPSALPASRRWPRRTSTRFTAPRGPPRASSWDRTTTRSSACRSDYAPGLRRAAPSRRVSRC